MPERREHLDEHVPQLADHSPGGFERRDVHFRGVIFFGLILVVAAGAIHLTIWGLYGFFDREAGRADPAPNPLVTVDADDRKIHPQERLRKVTRSFPEPRLQYDDVADMKALRSYENEKLGLANGHPYAWVDQNAGVVRIPIDRAMELLAQRGLGGAAPAPTTTQGKNAMPAMPAGGMTTGQNRGEDVMQSQTAPAGKSPTADERRAQEGSAAPPAGKATTRKQAPAETKKQ